MIYRNAFLSLGGTNLSAFMESCEPSFEVEMGDDTVMGDTARSNEPGLEVWTISATFKNPFASSGPDATVWPLKGTTFAVVWRPDSGSASATNPQYTGTGTVRLWNPVAGNVGDEGVATIEIVAAGAMARATT